MGGEPVTDLELAALEYACAHADLLNVADLLDGAIDKEREANADARPAYARGVTRARECYRHAERTLEQARLRLESAAGGGLLAEAAAIAGQS